MDPIVFIDGYTSSGPDNNVGDPADTMFLDVGEARTTAMIEVRLPPDAGSVPHIQFAHGIVLKLLNSDARRQGLADVTIELWDGHSEVSLESELESPVTQTTACAAIPAPSGCTVSRLKIAVNGSNGGAVLALSGDGQQRL